jgi:hypothetical protein
MQNPLAKIMAKALLSSNPLPCPAAQNAALYARFIKGECSGLDASVPITQGEMIGTPILGTIPVGLWSPSGRPERSAVKRTQGEKVPDFFGDCFWHRCQIPVLFTKRPRIPL